MRVGVALLNPCVFARMTREPVFERSPTRERPFEQCAAAGHTACFVSRRMELQSVGPPALRQLFEAMVRLTANCTAFTQMKRKSKMDTIKSYRLAAVNVRSLCWPPWLHPLSAELTLQTPSGPAISAHVPSSPVRPTDKCCAGRAMELGKPRGILDAKDDLSQGPKVLIVNPDLSKNNKNNLTHTAGTTFMGQFLDHDMMFDRTSQLGQPTNPITVPNARTPAFDLDTVYGEGPLESPQLTTPTIRSSCGSKPGGCSKICRATGHERGDPRRSS